ncbi:MAG: hypothetical protein ACR2KJ_13190 [Jatrophihabitans sp.]
MTRPGRRVGLVWLDAHGDFNTPDIDTSGFLDGHGLAMALGLCWQTLTGAVPSIAPADSFAAPDGLLADGIHRLLCQSVERAPVVSATWLPTTPPGAD